MGIICDLVIADEGAAEAILAADNLWETYPTYQTKHFTPVTLDELFALLDPESPDLGAWWEAPLAEQEEQAVYGLPPTPVARLAGLTEPERRDLAWRWWQSDAMVLAYKYSRLMPEEIVMDVRVWVDEICAFLRRAVEAGAASLPVHGGLTGGMSAPLGEQQNAPHRDPVGRGRSIKTQPCARAVRRPRR
jgi:hypothetical protein